MLGSRNVQNQWGFEMKKILATAGALAALATATAATAQQAPSAQANATARIYKPLTISKTQDLDFGTIVLAGASFSNETVTVATNGSVTCGSGGGNVTCGGAPTAAQFNLVGSNNASVTVSSPAFNLTGPSTLSVTPSSTSQVVNLGANGSTAGFNVNLGGSITLASSTPDGVYSGTWTVTANYQ